MSTDACSKQQHAQTVAGSH